MQSCMARVASRLSVFYLIYPNLEWLNSIFRAWYYPGAFSNSAPRGATKIESGHAILIIPYVA